ncbi:MAG: XrtA system polysaccharide chain length determinant, partial [bacterium]
NISLSGDRNNSSLYTIAYTNEERDVAKKVVQSLITVFIETTLGGEREDSVDAQKFLDQQIYDYEKRLTDAESKLAKFKQKYVGVLPGQGGGYYEKLSAARNDLEIATLQLDELVNRRNELKRQIAGEEPVFLSSGPTVGPESALDSRIHSLERRMDELLTRYTEKYPEVVQIRRLLADLEREKAQEIQKALAGQPAEYAGLQESPVYQQMRTMLAETEARVAELRIRVKEYQARVDDLDAMVDNIPVIEAELKQLNRDYNVVQGKHQELLTRRESALISQDVEQKSNDLVFRVIDPPFVPQNPNEPNKLLLNSVVYVAGLGLGGAIALFWSLLYPVVIDRTSLARISGLPVLGTVTLVQRPEEKKMASKNRLLFLLGVVALTAALLLVNLI